MNNCNTNHAGNKKSPFKNPSKKVVVITSMCLLVLVGIVAAVRFAGNKSSMPDPKRMGNEEMVEFVKSEKFKAADRDEKRDFMRNFMRDRITTTVQEYHSLPESEKTAYLDKTLDEMQKMREQMMDLRREFRPDGERPDGGSNRNFGPRSESGGQRDGQGRESQGPAGGPGSRMRNPETRRAFREQVPSEFRAQATAFMRDLRNRAQERGIDMPRRGPGGM